MVALVANSCDDLLERDCFGAEDSFGVPDLGDADSELASCFFKKVLYGIVPLEMDLALARVGGGRGLFVSGVLDMFEGDGSKVKGSRQ